MNCDFRSKLPQWMIVAMLFWAAVANGQDPLSNQSPQLSDPTSNQELSAAETLTIVREAFGYGYPIVENYKNLYAEAIDRDSLRFRGPLNALVHETVDLTELEGLPNTANLDLIHSWVWMDLRGQPIVVEVPEMDDGRYFSIQLVDLYTFNFDYLGTRTTGHGPGRYLVAGPNWQGDLPEGIEKVIRCETQFAFGKYRLQVRGIEDVEKARKIQAMFRVETLGAWLGQTVSAPPVSPDSVSPDSITEEFPDPATASNTALEFFTTLSYLLRYCPTHPSEVDLMARFARIGVGAESGPDPTTLSKEVRDAIVLGFEEAGAAVTAALPTYKSSEVFGSREYLKSDYMKRAVAAKMGLYTNSREESLYSLYRKDGDGNPLDGSSGTYSLKLTATDLPPVDAFWSLTIYDSQSQKPISNSIHRYQITSEMLATMNRSEDGSVTISIQPEAPTGVQEATWLPAPSGPFYMVLRLYCPKPVAYEGGWSPAMVWSGSSTPQVDDATPTNVPATQEVKPSIMTEEAKPEMERPTVWGEPTEVQVGVYVIDVDGVDSADQSFAASVYIQARWKNPLLRHAGPGPKNAGLSEVWNPSLIIVGQQMAWKSYPESVEILPDGTVNYRQRVWGRFSQPLKLQDFPFDQQTLSLQVVAAGLLEDVVTMTPHDNNGRSTSGIADTFSLPDFDVVSWEAKSTPYLPSKESKGLAGYEMKIYLTRQPDFYILKVIVPLCLIVIMSWLPRWIDPEQSGTNIGISTSAFLTLVAYLFAITVLLPKVSYVTRIDRFILLSTLTVFGGLLQTVANTALIKGDRQSLVKRMDQASRILYPVLLALVILVSFVL